MGQEGERHSSAGLELPLPGSEKGARLDGYLLPSPAVRSQGASSLPPTAGRTACICKTYPIWVGLLSLPGRAAGTRQVKETLLAWSQTSLGPILYFISAKNYRDARDDGC